MDDGLNKLTDADAHEEAPITDTEAILRVWAKLFILSIDFEIVLFEVVLLRVHSPEVFSYPEFHVSHFWLLITIWSFINF